MAGLRAPKPATAVNDAIHVPRLANRGRSWRAFAAILNRGRFARCRIQLPVHQLFFGFRSRLVRIEAVGHWTFGEDVWGGRLGRTFGDLCPGFLSPILNIDDPSTRNGGMR